MKLNTHLPKRNENVNEVDDSFEHTLIDSFKHTLTKEK